MLPQSTVPPEGPCFLLMSRTDKGSFARVNPFTLRRGLDQLVGPLETVKPIRSGALLVRTRASSQTATLMACREIAGLSISVATADRLNAREGVVRSEALVSLSNQELLDELAEQGVVRVQRLRSRNLEEWGPNPTIRMSFRGDTLPQAIRCGYMVIAVDPWVPPPQHCRKCWEYGHPTQGCRRRDPICARCGRGHSEADCTREAPQCFKCGRAHPVWDRNCRFNREKRESHYFAQQEAKATHRRASRAANFPPGRTYAEAVSQASSNRARRPQRQPSQISHSERTSPTRAATPAGTTETSPDHSPDRSTRAESENSDPHSVHSVNSGSDPELSAAEDSPSAPPPPSRSKIPVRRSTSPLSDRSRRQPSRAAKSGRPGNP